MNVRNHLIGLLVLVLMLGGILSPADARAQVPPPPGAQDAVQQCLARSKTTSPDQRNGAFECLGKMGAGAAAAVPALIEMLADASTFFWDGMGPDGRLTGGQFSARESAGHALLAIGAPALQPLIDALARHADARVREGAADVLSGFSDPRATEALIRALGDETVVKDTVRHASVLETGRSMRVCEAAAQQLVSMRAAAVSDALWSRLRDAPAVLRGRVLAVLVQRQDARVLPMVTANMKNPSWQTRVTAVTQIASLAPPDLVSVLLPVLKDSSVRVRAVAVVRLGAAAVAAPSGSPDVNRVVVALEALLRETEKEVDRRVKAYQDSSDILQVVYGIHDALKAIAEKRAR